MWTCGSSALWRHICKRCWLVKEMWRLKRTKLGLGPRVFSSTYWKAFSEAIFFPLIFLQVLEMNSQRLRFSPWLSNISRFRPLSCCASPQNYWSEVNEFLFHQSIRSRLLQESRFSKTWSAQPHRLTGEDPCWSWKLRTKRELQVPWKATSRRGSAG